MKKIHFTGIFVLLIITTAFAACVQAPVQEPASNNAVITYRLYGGFVMPTYAIQELVVTQDTATFTIGSADGTITKKFKKALTKEQYTAIVKVFSDNNFSSYVDRYDEGQNHVTDVGFSDITFTANNTSKTVTAYNHDGYLPEGLVRIREKLRETIAFTQALDESQVRDLAENWTREAPTYTYDGSGIQFVSSVPQGSDPVRHLLTYRFTSSHAGYGNRSAQVTAQVMTEHTILVTIVDDNVESAVIDGKWDEMGQFLIGSTITLSYQPKMCEKTVWQEWEENSGRVYIRMPTDEEIITHYYAAVYETEVRNVTKIDRDLMTCQACNVCPTTYHFELAVNATSMQPLLDTGWTRIN